MKKFKFLMMAMAATMLAGFVSCQDDVDDPNSGKEKAQAYTSITIVVPNDATTKSNEDSGLVSEATVDEYKINTVDLYFFENDPAAAHVVTIRVAGTDLATSSTGGTNATVKYTSEAMPINNIGTFRVYAVINGGTAATVANAAALEGMSTTHPGLSLGSVNTDGNSTNGGLIMTSRSAAGAVYATVTIGPEHIISNPATMTLDIERSVAKISYKADNTANTYDLDYGTPSNKIAEVEFQSYQLVNLMKDFYLFRRVNNLNTPLALANPGLNFGSVSDPSTSGTGTSYNPYVIDPRTLAKTIDANSDVDANIIVSGAGAIYNNGTASVALPTATTPSLLSYSLENTMHQESQKKGYTTGIIFEAQITPEEVLDGTGTDIGSIPADFWYYQGKFYETLADVISDNSLPTTITSGNYSDFGIREYKGGICYYKYWIKHFPDENETMFPMEYGIVRNNDYQLTISSVSLPGDETGVYDPNEDDEIETRYFQVNLNIRPWITRVNNIKF